MNVLRALSKVSFDKSSVYISKGRKTEIGDYTCMKTKAVSDKSFFFNLQIIAHHCKIQLLCCFKASR